MDLLLCGADFTPCSNPIDDFKSLTWTRKWYDADVFALELPPKYFSAALSAAYAYNPDESQFMRVESVNYGDGNVEVDGRGLKSLLDLRVLLADVTVSAGANVETTMRGLVSSNTSGARAITGLSLDTAGGYSETVAEETKLSAGTALSDALWTLCKPVELSWAITRDSSGNLKFGVLRGLDRTTAQTANGYAIFSTSFENLKSLKYSRCVTDWRNVAVSETGSLDRSGTDERREVYCSDSGDFAETLDDRKIELTCTVEAYDDAILRYGDGYALGDKASVSDEQSGIAMDDRIVQVDLVYEGERRRVLPHIGTGEPSIKKILKNLVEG